MKRENRFHFLFGVYRRRTWRDKLKRDLQREKEENRIVPHRIDYSSRSFGHRGVSFSFFLLDFIWFPSAFVEATGSWVEETGPGNKRRRGKENTCIGWGAERKRERERENPVPLGRANGQTADGDGGPTPSNKFASSSSPHVARKK